MKIVVDVEKAVTPDVMQAIEDVWVSILRAEIDEARRAAPSSEEEASRVRDDQIPAPVV